MYIVEGFVPAWMQGINWPPTVSSAEYFCPHPLPHSFLAAFQAEEHVQQFSELNWLAFWNTFKQCELLVSHYINFTSNDTLYVSAINSPSGVSSRLRERKYTAGAK